MEPLEKARIARQRNKELGIKPLDPIEKSKANPKSLRLAINAKCFDCCCGQKTEVRQCTVESCSLWKLRPWKGE